MMTESKCEPEQFKGRTVIMSMNNDIEWSRRGSKTCVLRVLSELLSMLEKSRKDIGRFWGLDPKRNGTEPMPANRMENGIKLLKA